MPTEYIGGTRGFKFYLEGKQIEGVSDFKFNIPPKESERRYTFTNKGEASATISGVKWFPEGLSKYYHLMKYGSTWRIRKKNKKIYGKKLSKLLNKMFGM